MKPILPALSETDSSAPNEKSSVASISKAFAILRLLGSAQSPLTMTEIARDTNLTPSSCHDLVTTLVQIGLAQSSEIGKSYELGPRLVRLAKLSLNGRADLSGIQRAMNLISDKYDINLSIFQPFGDNSYVSTQVSEGSAPIRIRLSPGQVLPLFRGSPGKYFAAHTSLSEEAYREEAARIGLTSEAEIAQFKTEVHEDCKRGWSLDCGRTQRGVATIAVPILSPQNQFHGAIELVMFEKQSETAPITSIVDDALELANAVAEKFSAA
jgi:DNA-binding IclR family transcriptional regulator